MKKTNLLLLFFLLIISCNTVKGYNTFDSWSGLTEKEFEDTVLGVKEKYDSKNEKIDTNLNVNNLISEVPPPPMGNGDLISFSITEEVPLKDVFIELGRLADIDIQIDPKINKGIIFKISDKPLNLVVDKICDLAGLKYSYLDDILKIERDLPHFVNYDIDILIEHQLWSTIKTSLEYILDIFPVKKQDPLIDGSKNSVSDDENNKQNISINKEAGIISVYANEKAQKAVKAYIEQAKKNYGSQVLIEAKVIEISLKEEFNAGINWSLTKDVLGANPGETTKITKAQVSGLGSSSASAETGMMGFSFSISAGKYDLNAVVNAMSEFGKSKTLSSPRISTLNNQKANLEFTNAIVYFSVEAKTTTSIAGGSTTDKTSTKQEDEEGVKLEITPVINSKTREITLTVIPELRTLLDYVADPVNQGNKVPRIQKRKIETSLKLKSGDVMVIGGLMNERLGTVRRGIPFLKDIPVLGWAFGYAAKTKELTEVAIFIKATIVDDFELMNERDKKFYKNLGR